MDKAFKELVNQLWFVVIDLNTKLDYETKLGILHTISKHTDLSVDSLWAKAQNASCDEFELI